MQTTDEHAGWEPSDKHPAIPAFNQAKLDWRLVDWRNGDMYIAMIDHIYKCNEATKVYTPFLVNPNHTAIGSGAAAILESANKIFLLAQMPVESPIKRRLWETDLATGAFMAASLRGPAEAAITYSRAHGLARSRGRLPVVLQGRPEVIQTHPDQECRLECRSASDVGYAA